MSTTHKRPAQEDVAAELMAGAITMEEVARKRRTVQIGDKITLEREVEPDEKSKKKIYIKERCTVIAKYPALAILQRPPARNGRKRTCTCLWVELCMADRGRKF